MGRRTNSNQLNVMQHVAVTKVCPPTELLRKKGACHTRKTVLIGREPSCVLIGPEPLWGHTVLTEIVSTHQVPATCTQASAGLKGVFNSVHTSIRVRVVLLISKLFPFHSFITVFLLHFRICVAIARFHKV